MIIGLNQIAVVILQLQEPNCISVNLSYPLGLYELRNAVFFIVHFNVQQIIEVNVNAMKPCNTSVLLHQADSAKQYTCISQLPSKTITTDHSTNLRLKMTQNGIQSLLRLGIQQIMQIMLSNFYIISHVFPPQSLRFARIFCLNS